MKINETGIYLDTTTTAILTWLYTILALVFAALNQTDLMNTLLGASLTTLILWAAPVLYRATHTNHLQYPEKDHKHE
jgi:fatty acid desaturase